MKKFIQSTLVLIFMLCISGLFNVQAEENQTKQETEVTLHSDGVKNRPRMPAKIIIHCTYRNGELYFSFPEEIEYLIVSVEHAESKSTWTSRINREESMFISTAKGTYTLSAETSNGQHFSGTLYVTE